MTPLLALFLARLTGLAVKQTMLKNRCGMQVDVTVVVVVVVVFANVGG